MTKTPNSSIFLQLVVAAISASSGVVLLVIMLWQAERLVRLGLFGNLWFLLLLTLGLAAAITSFSLFKSYARYTGKTLNGHVEIGGPAVIMFIVIIVGFKFVPPPIQDFELTILIHDAAGSDNKPSLNHGTITLNSGTNTLRQPINAEGKVHFTIPAKLLNQKVPISLASEKYELIKDKLKLLPDRRSIDLQVQAKRVHFDGGVYDEQNKPLKGVQVSISEESDITDEHGKFDIDLPADLPDEISFATFVKEGYITVLNKKVLLGANPMDVIMEEISVDPVN